MFINSLPSDTQTVAAYLTTAATTTILDNSDPITILSIAIANKANNQVVDFYCDSQYLSSFSVPTAVYSPVNVPCNDDLIVHTRLASDVTVVINYVPYYTQELSTTTREYDGANLNEWLFVVAVFLFFLSWISWSRISFTKE